MSRMSSRYTVFALIATCSLTACDEGPTQPSTGTIRITTSTAGADLDHDGYICNVDGWSRAIGLNESVTWSDIGAGDHKIELTGLVSNCQVGGDNPRDIAVPAGRITDTTFEVTCEAVGQIAFLRHVSNEYSDIYAMIANGSPAVNLTNNPEGNDSDPTWSPDGRKVAFTRSLVGNPEIYVMNADGSEQVNLTNHPDHDHSATWSPDGTKIAFYSGRDHHYAIYVVNADGSGVVRLTDDQRWSTDPAWSPDGGEIAFTRYHVAENREIYVMDADGSNLVRLTDDRKWDREPAWSPDGARIAFMSDRDGNFEIYVMDSDGSNQARLTDDPALDGSPVWSPDGTKIAFFSRRDGNAEIYVMNADGSNPVNLTNSLAEEGDPAWFRHLQ